MSITLVRAVIIYFFIIMAVRIMGKRQVGELKPQELVITILISAVATTPLEENSIPLANSLLPIMIFVALEMITSGISMKSITARNILQGKPIFIIKNGKLQQKELRNLRFTIDDLIDALRQQGAFDISEVENAIVETNGSLSVQLKSEYSPVTPKQLKKDVDEQDVPITIIMDGQIVEEYFNKNKIDKRRIEQVAKASNVELKDIMLLTLDDSGKTFLIKKDDK